jgi:hypothetical protein
VLSQTTKTTYSGGKKDDTASFQTWEADFDKNLLLNKHKKRIGYEKRVYLLGTFLDFNEFFFIQKGLATWLVTEN